MTDLIMLKYEDNMIKEGEYIAWTLEGPSSEEYVLDPSNFGKTIVGFKEIDLVNDVTFWSPRWLKNKAKEILEQTEKK